MNESDRRDGMSEPDVPCTVVHVDATIWCRFDTISFGLFPNPFQLTISRETMRPNPLMYLSMAISLLTNNKANLSIPLSFLCEEKRSWSHGAFVGRESNLLSGRGGCLIKGGSTPHGSSPYHEEEFELEVESPPLGKKRERARRMESDDSSSEEEKDEVIFEDEAEEEEESSKKPGKVPFESENIISTGDRLCFVKSTSTYVDNCRMDNCTIHGPLKNPQQENPKPRKKFTIGARITVGPQGRRDFLEIPTTPQILIHARSMIEPINWRYMLMVH